MSEVVSSARKRAAIVGAAYSDVGVTPAMTSLQLAAQASLRALEDAGLTLGDVDAVFTQSGDYMPAVLLSEYLGLRPIVHDGTNSGGVSNLIHLSHAVRAIEAGECQVALIAYGSDQRSTRTRSPGGRPDGPRSVRGQFEVPTGQLAPIGHYAMLAQRHTALYGTPPEAFAEVAVSARRWAQLNPVAERREPMDIAAALASPMISEPLRRSDCCLVSDGGGAIVVVAADRLPDVRHPPVRMLGHASQISHHYQLSQVDEITRTAAAATGPRALAAAGVTIGDIDVAQLYDSFTINILLLLEDLGFCAKGESADFVAGGTLGPGGSFPINTHGGGLSFCHPGQLGMLLLVEAVLQLRGQCDDRQVDGAEVALVHATGGITSVQASTVLARG